jgi:hypothetical protein
MVNFQSLVIIIATIILIGTLTFNGYALYMYQHNQSWPPVISACPDNWTSTAAGCTSPSTNINIGTLCPDKRKQEPSGCQSSPHVDLQPAVFGTREGSVDNTCKAQWAQQRDIRWEGIWPGEVLDNVNPDNCSNPIDPPPA